MTSNSFSNTNYLLVDNIQKLNELGDYASKQIITFDYDSHIFLEKQKIAHIISDKFHSVKELDDIENKIYSLVKWYEIPSIQNEIFSDNINLGELFFLEFRDELVSFLKKFIEISNIIKLNPHSHYYVSENMLELISPLTKNVTKMNIKNKDISIYNSIDVPLKFGSKQLTIKLSTKNVSKTQNFLNKITQILFLNKKINQKFPSILLVNFSTIKNEELLLKIPNFHLNVIKYDRTTAAIWNKHSLNIIKNSNCVVENEFTLLDKTSLEKIKQKEHLFSSKLDSILSSKDLEIHFSLNQLNFWSAFKPLFMRLCNKRFLQATKDIELAKNLLKKFSFSKILLFHESGMVEQIILKLAKQQKIPIFVLQHGMYFDSKERLTENHFQRLIPKNSDNVVVWGNLFKNYLLNNGVDSNKIKVFGSVFFDKLFQNKISSHSDSGYVLLASDPSAFNRPIDLTIHQKELYRNTVEQICKTVSQNNKKLIIKTHPQKNQHEQEIAKKTDPTIRVFNSGDIHPLIQSSDLVITTDVTTVILEAMIMQKPVISVRMKKHYGKPEIFNYCNQIPLDSLDSWIKLFYTNSEIKNKLISKGNEFLKIYFKNRGNASNEILKFLET